MSRTGSFYPQYFYRSNPNGTVDSICSICFWTVVTANTFAELKPSENAHRCIQKTSGPNRAA
jgi:hypothetical protein